MSHVGTGAPALPGRGRRQIGQRGQPRRIGIEPEHRLAGTLVKPLDEAVRALGELAQGTGDA
ncbi:MAG: hypothetical protein R3E68_20450 [Burkholderiaceae bacterium]